MSDNNSENKLENKLENKTNLSENKLENNSDNMTNLSENNSDRKSVLKLDRNNTSFLYEVFNWMKDLKPETPYEFLTYYQYIVHKFYTDIDIGTRGMLIYHTMGMGKTLLAVAISMTMKDYDPIVLSSLSLHANFAKDIKLYIKLRTENDSKFKLGTLDEDDLNKWIKKRFKFITLKASNMLSQLAKAVTQDEALDMEYDIKIKEILNIGNIDGKLLIVDEAHNLFRSIINGSKNALRLYELIMKSRKAKVLFLTGTPIAKNPFELVPCFNMLGGHYTDKEEITVLPEKYPDFVKYFIDEKTNSLKNKGKFQNRIQGMVSYVTHTDKLGERSDVYEGNRITLDDKNSKDNNSKDKNSKEKKTYPGIGEFPDQLPLIIKRVNMEEKQYTAYLLARESEKIETSRQRKFEKLQVDPLTIPGRGSTSTFRIRSRQISNYYQEGIGFKTKVSDIPLEKTESPKFRAMLEDIKKSKGITMVFSQLLHMSGLEVFARYLVSQGWMAFDLKNPNKYNEKRINESDKNDERTKTFAYISGDMKEKEREIVKKILKSESNKYGSKISVILISDAGAEGLDLKNIRLIQLLEPQWTDSKYNQVIHRGIRKGSHDMLPPEERNTQIIMYLAIKPESVSDGDADMTTDVVIYTNSKSMNKLNNEFEKAIQEVSIECYVNGGDNCRMCNPNGTLLFDWNLVRDMSREDPCKELRKVEKKLNKVIVNDETYYWEENKESPFRFSIFYYDDTLNSYKRMPEDDIRFISIVEELEKSIKK